MQRTIRIIFFTLLSSSAAFCQTPQKDLNTLSLPWIKFNWVGDSLANRYFDKIAITIPIRIDHLPYNNLVAQLDLGAVHTMFYGKSLAPYLQLSPELARKYDTTKRKEWENNVPNFFFYHVNITLDQVSFPDREIENYANFGDSLTVDSVKTSTMKIVATIAPDLFQNKFLIIDYPNQRICVLDSLPGSIIQRASFVPIKIRNGRIKIPFMVDARQHDIMFDTGSSIFSIFSSSENSVFFAGATQPITDTIMGQSWGQKIPLYGKKISSEVKLGNHTMPPALIYYKVDKAEKTFEDEEEIIGITGNAYFLNSMIIIDYRNKRFGVM
jgi:hypothetical protein